MRCARESMRLYAVTDNAWLGERTLREQVEDCLRGGATFVQLREKGATTDALVRQARELLPLCRQYGVPFVIDDDVEAAIRSGADGVHVGQSDLAAAQARARLGADKLLGVSVQTVEQARQAQAAGADYLGVGTVFPTSTKPDADFVSRATLRAICEAVTIPVVAIGGIGEANLAQLRGTGIDGVAVGSALFAAADIEAAARTLRGLSEAAFGGAAAGGTGEKCGTVRGAIFDMDGTLLDSMGIWETVGEDYLRARGRTPAPGLRETLRPMSLRQAAAYCRRTYGLPESEEEIAAGVNAMVADFYRETAPLKEGVRAALEAMRAAGVRMCVATATDRPLAECALRRCGVWEFFGLLTCSEVGAGKDTPAIYEAGLQLLGTRKAETLVFEDALHAVQTAKAAGFPVVGVYDAHAAGQQDALRALCDRYLRSFAQWA